MMKITTKEEVLITLINNVIPNQYDSKFLFDLYNKMSYPSAKVTTRQTALVDRLIRKYRKQLLNQNIQYEAIIDLPWKHKIIKSQDTPAGAYITIINDTITLISPYNKWFLTALRGDELSQEFIWNKKEKMFEAKYNTDTLRVLVHLTTKYFNVVHYCPITSELINSIRGYESCYWGPTLIDANGNLLVAALNEALYTATKNIQLNADATTLSLLAEYGIEIDHSVTKDDPKLEFAGKFMPTVDLEEATDLLAWLLELGCDYIIMLGYQESTQGTYIADSTKDKLYDSLLHSLLQAGIKISFFTDKTLDTTSIHKYPVIVQFMTTSLFNNYSCNGIPNIKKIITIVDSTPVNVK